MNTIKINPLEALNPKAKLTQIINAATLYVAATQPDQVTNPQGTPTETERRNFIYTGNHLRGHNSNARSVPLEESIHRVRNRELNSLWNDLQKTRMDITERLQYATDAQEIINRAKRIQGGMYSILPEQYKEGIETIGLYDIGLDDMQDGIFSKKYVNIN